MFTALNDLVLINLKIECCAIFWEMKLEFQIGFKRLGNKKLALKKGVNGWKTWQLPTSYVLESYQDLKFRLRIQT